MIVLWLVGGGVLTLGTGFVILILGHFTGLYVGMGGGEKTHQNATELGALALACVLQLAGGWCFFHAGMIAAS